MKIFKIAQSEETIRFKCPITGAYIDGLRHGSQFSLFTAFDNNAHYILETASFDDAIAQLRKYDPKIKIPRSGKKVKENNEDITEYLASMGIKFSIGEKGAVLIERDSIVNKIQGKDENDSYSNLLLALKSKFNDRFFFGAKTDDWLLLQRGYGG